MNLNIELSRQLDALSIAQDYRQHQCVHIPGACSKQSTEALLAAIKGFPNWNLCTRLKGKHIDMDSAVTDAWPKDKREELLAYVHEPAQRGFQYLYKTVPVYDLYHGQEGSSGLVASVYKGLNSSPSLDFFRQITGEAEIGFVDCQITCFEPGHFLTRHDDVVEGKNRVAAYVLSLTPDWQPDWGGALHFYDEHGHTTRALIPKFNALNVFAVGQPHAVSMVTPFAGAKRYAITGWLRTGEDPGSKSKAPA